MGEVSLPGESSPIRHSTNLSDNLSVAVKAARAFNRSFWETSRLRMRRFVPKNGLQAVQSSILLNSKS